MRQTEGYEKVDTNKPYDAIDALLTKALYACVWVAIGRFTTAAIIYFARNF